jgi:uncharacterized membrane protein
LHISSTKRTPALTKKEIRATTSPNSLGRHLARVAHLTSSTAIAVDIAKAISCTGVAPASWRW